MSNKKKKRALKLKTRLFINVSLLLAACALAVTFFNSRYMEKVYLWYEKRSVTKMVEQIESFPNIELTYYSELPSLELSEDVSIVLYNSYNELIYESRYAPDLSGKRLYVISREDNSEDSSYYSVLQEENKDTRYNIYGKTMKNGYYIEVTSLVSPLIQNARISTGFTTILGTAGMILALIFVSIFATRFAKPVEEINEITGEMAKLDFTRKCSTDRDDEIGALAKNINYLSDNLDKALSELEDKNTELRLDIEKKQKLNEIRKEFVSSVSHELKTPIAIIRGYAEGLLALDKDDTQTVDEYSHIIMSEADRMNELVRRLLEISMYESGGYILNESTFSIGALVTEYLNVSRPIYADKSIDTENLIPEGIMVSGDKDKIFTVINNYIQNAVSHTQTGGKIICRYEDNGKLARIFVFNTGKHISDEDSDKLFLNFYRGDKSHSRSEGRFGLGLSIVKAITEVHKTACGFCNVDGGVEFWFDIKKAAESETGGKIIEN